MKIGITGYPVYGGSGVVATELGLQLARRGHEIHFITYAQPFRLPYFVENVFFHEVKVPAYPLFEYPPYSLALSVAMHATTVRHGLDLLHVHYAVPHATSAWLAKEMLGRDDFPILTTLHGTDITLVGRDPSYETVTRFSLQRSDGLTAVSEYLRRETIDRFQVPPEQIRVIPNFVDLEEYRPGTDDGRCHRSHLAPAGERVLMHISNFRPVKRVADVVRIFARVARRLPARLVLIGDGPDRVLAEQAAEEERVADRVLFLGKQESVAELLACADLFLLPSALEAFGLVALEAMACGVPVVATNVGGIPEVVPHGTAGYLADVGAIDEMAEAAWELLADPDRHARAGRAARTAAERYAAENVVPLYEAHYREVLNR
jgi:L-malate glycosyltransferase